MKPLLALGALATLLLSSCGSTSSIQPTSGSLTAETGTYDSLVVKPFKDATAPDDFSAWTAEEQQEHRASVKRAGEKIATLIVSNTKSGSRFKSIGDKQGPGRNLVIEGEITRFNNGIASLRLWVGMGAGSAYLDGVANFKDQKSGREIGKIVFDKNSWPLGGAIASAQNADSFAEGAAEKIAEEALKFAR